MEFKDCDMCSLPFPAEEDWQRICLGCWKKEKSYALGKGDKAFLATQEALGLVRDELRENRRILTGANDKVVRLTEHNHKLSAMVADLRREE